MTKTTSPKQSHDVRNRFRLRDGQRLVRIAQTSGLVVTRLEVQPDGKISVITSGPSEPSTKNEWDDDGEDKTEVRKRVR